MTPTTVNGELLIRSCLSERILLAEDVLGHLVAEEDDAALLLFVLGVDEAAARRRKVLAGVAVVEPRADDAAVDGLASVGRGPCARRSARPRSRRARACARGRSRCPRAWAGSAGPRAGPCRASTSRRATGSPGSSPWPGRWTSSAASGPRRTRAAAGSSPCPRRATRSSAWRASSGAAPSARKRCRTTDRSRFIAASELHRHDGIEPRRRRAPGSTPRGDP